MSPANTITMANHTANKTQTITLQDLKFLSSGNKCYLPITLKDGEQQVMAQIDTKNIVFVPQQMTTVDGQQGERVPFGVCERRNWLEQSV